MSEPKNSTQWLNGELTDQDNDGAEDMRAGSAEPAEPAGSFEPDNGADINNNKDSGAANGGGAGATGDGSASGGLDTGSGSGAGAGAAGGVAAPDKKGRNKNMSRSERKERKAQKKNKTGARVTRRRKRKKGWIVVLLLILAGAGYFLYTSVTGNANAAPLIRYTDLSRGDLRNVVSVKGNVQSDVKRNVYSTLTLMVKSVDVSVGDAVREGQILCLLDKEDLELNIEQQNAELNASIQSSDKQIESNEQIYNDAAENLRSGTNAQILSAEAAVRNAQVSLETAQSNYDNLLYDYTNGTSASRLSAESAANSALIDLENRERDYENNKVLYAAGAISQDALIQMENALTSAQTRYDDALTSLENTKVSEERAVEQSRNSLRSAQTAYNNALTSLSSAQNSAEQELARYESNVETSRIGANIESREIALKKLEKQLIDSEIRSPVDGVVTAVYANEGSAGTGLLFVIEDPDNLKISIKVKEYDTGKLYPGMPVVIKSDAIADAEYAGTLAKIDPAAVKNAMGDTDTISDIEFGAEVSVDSADTQLRIGMNARLDIIIEQRDDVFYVPFDTITEDESGNSIVYIVEDIEEGGAVAKAIPVTIGLETDFYIEISGAGLAEGSRVINEPAESSLYDGMIITYQGAADASQGNGRFGGRFGMRIG